MFSNNDDVMSTEELLKVDRRIAAHQNEYYLAAGRLIAYSIVHRGPRFFHQQ